MAGRAKAGAITFPSMRRSAKRSAPTSICWCFRRFERAIARLKTNPHARRIINHFIDARKPIAAIGAGVSCWLSRGRLRADRYRRLKTRGAELIAAGATITEESQVIDGNIFCPRTAATRWSGWRKPCVFSMTLKWCRKRLNIRLVKAVNVRA